MTFLKTNLLGASLVVGALALSPLAATGTVHSNGSIASATNSIRHVEAYPLPSAGLEIKLKECESLAALLDMFAKATGETLLYGSSTEALLNQVTTGLHSDLTIAPGQVYSTVQDILYANRVVLTDMRRTTPRMLMVESLDSANRASIKAKAIYVSADSLGQYSDFSAMLITTTVYLPNINVRTMGNSMRQLVVDPNTMQLIPVPESSQVILTGFGNSIVRVAAMLKDMDKAAEKANTARAEAAAAAGKLVAEAQAKE
jgi:hypothetical protein